MNTAIQAALDHAVQSLQAEGTLPSDWKNTSVLTRTKDRSHGDFASNIAMMGAKVAGMKPRDLAEKILANLPEVVDIAKAEIAGPGFINFFLNADQRFTVLDQIQAQKEQFGKTQANAAKKIQVEFVSANPTSSLHVGHGRGAAYGMTVANLLEATGAKVEREYYVNDAGRQMDILATSTYLRYLELSGQTLVFPKNAYQVITLKKSPKVSSTNMLMLMYVVWLMFTKMFLKMCNMLKSLMPMAIKWLFQAIKKSTLMA